MGIELGISEPGGDARFETLRDKVFQAFCLIVKFFDRVVKDFIEKRLNQSMVTNDLKGTFSPFS